MVNHEILEDTKPGNLLPGTTRKTGPRETAVYGLALVRNDKMGTRLPELQMKEEMLRHQRAVNTMTFLGQAGS